jgi:hypothetical protein
MRLHSDGWKITLLLRNEIAVDVERVFIVTSVVTVRQAERNEEQRVKEIYTHRHIYTLPQPPRFGEVISSK